MPSNTNKLSLDRRSSVINTTLKKTLYPNVLGPGESIT